MFHRKLEISQLVQRRSCFLFGARATGKSTLIEQQLPGVHVIDLLDARIYGQLLRDPTALSEMTKPDSLVAIDEIQKIPSLLDEVHRLIAQRQQRFLLTGSSARKLKRGAANLLAGRARNAALFPLCVPEIETREEFDLLTYLNTGGLPQMYGDSEAMIDLRAYVDLYLREEIQAEALTRNLGSFAATLDALALSNGEEINATTLASDISVTSRTVLNYVQILEDTLIAFLLPVYRKTKKRKPTSRKKLYFFDVGVTNALCKRSRIEMGSELFGKAYEHFLILETRACRDYLQSQDELAFWRTSSGFEVDLVIGDHFAFEMKSTNKVSDKHLRGLRALKEDQPKMHFFVVSMDAIARKTADGIQLIHWKEFVSRLWQGDFFSNSLSQEYR